MRSNSIDQIIEPKEIRQTKAIVDQLLIGIIANDIDVLPWARFVLRSLMSPLCFLRYTQLPWDCWGYSEGLLLFFSLSLFQFYQYQAGNPFLSAQDACSTVVLDVILEFPEER